MNENEFPPALPDLHRDAVSPPPVPVSTSRWAVVWAWLRTKGVALGAAVLGLLAFIYGRRTASVLTAQVKAADARDQVVRQKLEQAERKAGEAKSEVERETHDKAARALQLERQQIEAERLALVNESNDLPVMSDVDLVDAYNRRGSE